MQAVRIKLIARGLVIDVNTTWITLIILIKEKEGGIKYFKPITDYDSFKWNSTHFDVDGDII